MEKKHCEMQCQRAAPKIRAIWVGSTTGALTQYPKESPTSSSSQAALLKDHKSLKPSCYTPIDVMSVLSQQDREGLGKSCRYLP